MHVCIHTKCITGACEGQKKVLEPLELQLQVFLNLHVLGTKPRSSSRAASVINLFNIYVLILEVGWHVLMVWLVYGSQRIT